MYQILFIAILLQLTASKQILDVEESNFGTIVDGSKHTVLLFTAPWCRLCNDFLPTYAKLSEAYENFSDVEFAQVNIETNKAFSRKYNLERLPMLALFPMNFPENPLFNKGVYYLRDMSIWINEVAGTNVEFPEESRDTIPHYVVELTDDNFNEVVRDSDKYVLVKYYAPWCGYCQALEPIYNELSRVLSDSSDVVLAALNCDTYTEHSESIVGYPTIILYKGDDSIEFEFDLTLDSLILFMNIYADVLYNVHNDYVGSYGNLHSVDIHVIKETEFHNKAAMSNVFAALDSVPEDFDLIKDIYLRTWKDVIVGGQNWVRREQDRINAELESADLTLKQKGDLKLRYVALDAFYIFSDDERYLRAHVGDQVDDDMDL